MRCPLCIRAAERKATQCFLCGRHTNEPCDEAREQIIESVLTKGGGEWRTECAEFMRTNSIMPEEVEAAIGLSQKLGCLIMEIRKIKLLDLVSDYTQLLPDEAEYEGACPFAECNSGRIRVNLQSGHYLCYTCCRSGDTISFVQDLNSCCMDDALEFLAQRYKLISH